MAERTRLSLNGTWQFWPDPHSRLAPDTLPHASLSIHVPGPWQAQFEALRDYSGLAWYRRELDIPAPDPGERLFLGFGAVDYFAEVWLNGQLVGTHEGGYLPFELDVTNAARPDANTLVVRVDDPNEAFREIPHGKQSWYGPVSGIWQGVWLETRPALHVQGVRLFPDLGTGAVRGEVRLAGQPAAGARLVAEIVGPDGEMVARVEQPLVPDAVAVTWETTVTEPRPWLPTAPNLYRVALQVLEGETEGDVFEDSFGFRTIEARNGRLLLNGEPLFLRAALDQDYYPDTIYTPPSLEFLEAQLRRAQELGLNCLRCHIKVPDPRYYEVADRLGMLIWTELPNWHSLTDRANALGRATMEGILERDGNHPSIIIWTLINEDWGTNLLPDEGHRAWLKEMYHWLKALDPTRLVVDNSPCVGNFHVETDIDDYHFYRAIPDQRHAWDAFVDHFASRTAPTFSPFGDAVRTGKEVLILSEFGNWGLPNVEELVDAEGRDPWWFDTGMEWGEGVVYPHGVRERFRRFHLERVFGDWQTFIEATQWQQFHALRYEIEAIRRRPEIQGYVITEFTDVHWECNGLLDMRRNPKAFHDRFAALNTDTLIVPTWQRTAFWLGEKVKVDLAVSHGAGQPVEGATLHWELVGSASRGQMEVATTEPGTVQPVGAVRFLAPPVKTAGHERLALTLHDGAGASLATSELPLAFFPRWQGPTRPDAPLWTPNLVLAHQLAALGYTIVARPDEAALLLVESLDASTRKLLREGQRLLWLAGHAEAVGQTLNGLSVVARKGTVWYGDWASSFAWLRREGPFARLPGGPLLDAHFDAVMPRYVLAGVSPWDFEEHIHAGLFVGWIHKPVGLIAERRYGAGHLVATTFHLTPALLGRNPVATTLWDALVELGLGG